VKFQEYAASNQRHFQSETLVRFRNSLASQVAMPFNANTNYSVTTATSEVTATLDMATTDAVIEFRGRLTSTDVAESIILQGYTVTVRG